MSLALIFSCLGGLIDLNVLDHSITMGLIFTDEFHSDNNFMANEMESQLPYFLVDHIYPNCCTFEQTLQS